MSETPTVAEPAAATPPPDRRPSGDQRADRRPLAYLLTHQSGVVIVVALVIALLVGALLIRLQGVSPWYAYETLIKQALFVPAGSPARCRRPRRSYSPASRSCCRCGWGCSTSVVRAS